MSVFFADLAVQKFYVSTITLDVLFCYVICARIMDVHTASVCP